MGSQNSGDWHPYMLTAGHCLSTNGDWAACPPGEACRFAGREVAGYFDNRGDAGVVRLDRWIWAPERWRPGFAIYEGWVNWWNQGVSTVRRYLGENAPEGLVVCHQGITTGSACGTVTAKFAHVTYTEPDGTPITTAYDMVKVTSTCSNLGDSGGPWTMRDEPWAVGIESGGPNGPKPCSEANDDTSYVEPINRALLSLNVKLYGRP